MRILVTGGAGFIGSHLCERLLAQGEEVVCVDNFFTGSKQNIFHLLDNHRFELIRHDIIEPILLEVDQVYHLACPASPIHYQYNPVKTIKTSVMGTINMLGLAKRVRARILLASTSEVYGDPQVHPQTEAYWGNVNPIGIRSCYDEGKRVAETLMMDYHRQNKVDVRIIRIFNTYGPRMALQDGRVVSNFIAQALNLEVHEKHHQDPDHDGQLIEGHQSAANFLGSDLGNIQRGKHGGCSDGHAPGKAGPGELPQVLRKSRGERRKGKKDRAKDLGTSTWGKDQWKTGGGSVWLTEMSLRRSRTP